MNEENNNKNQQDQQQRNMNQNNQNQLFYEVANNQPERQMILEQQNQKNQNQLDLNRRVSSSSQSSRRGSSSPSRSSSGSESQDQKWQYESIKQGEQVGNQDDKIKQSQNIDQQKPGKASESKPVVEKQRVIRYKYCCKKCKHADRDKDKKACVCVVPRDQRRTHLGNQGCQTCGCAGCSKQDFIHRGQDPQYHPEDKKKQSKKKQQAQLFEARNGCCKNCMKAFSKSNKSCICQVPQEVRKTKLSSTGCKICGCKGCNPEDRKGDYGHQGSSRAQKKQRRSRSRSQRKKDRKQRRSRSKQKSKKRSKSRSPQIIDTYAMNFHNIDRSIIGSMIINEYQIDPALLGFGIPQRSSSYLFGKNRQK